MKKLLIYLIFVSSVFGSELLQNSNIWISYKDIILSNNTVWALTKKGKIELFDGRNGDRINKKVLNEENVLLISQDRKGNIYVANNRKQILRYNDVKNVWDTIGNFENEPRSILVNNKGICFAVTESGIQNINTKKTYFNSKSLNDQIIYIENWKRINCTYIDKNDIIWLGFSYGEWGGNLIAFNSIQNEFIEIKDISNDIALLPINSFCEDSTSLYISGGLQHLDSSDGIIFKIDSLISTIVFKNDLIEGECIGPLVYNSNNHSMYLYSQNGLFLVDKSKDLSQISNWKKVIKPKSNWIYGQPEDKSDAMNVLKFCIVDKDRIVFLSENFGIGFFDGQKLTFR
jgi:hypothetical protein